MQKDDQKIHSVRLYQLILQHMEEATPCWTSEQYNFSNTYCYTQTSPPPPPHQADGKIVFITCNQITEVSKRRLDL